jgi:histone-lysine N-methyltransferase SETMAR
MGSRPMSLKDETKGLKQHTKVIVLVIWGLDGPALVEIVPPNVRVSAKYLCEFAIPSIEANVKTHRPKQGLKRIIFHWDHVASHRAKVTIAKISELGMNQMPHPPYSPDIAPSGFFLFGHLKHKLQGCSYESADELFTVITDLMENLEKSLLHRVFSEWISPLHLVVETGGEFIQT